VGLTDRDERAPLHQWLCDPLPRDVESRLDRLRDAEGITHIAVMPDVHLSQRFCIGTVIASPDRVYPEAVGSDIGCGMVAVRFDAGAQDVVGNEAGAERILRALRTTVPITRHGHRTVREVLPAELTQSELSTESLSKRAQRDGLSQLGTLGRGNHFLEMQSDDEGALWLMVHSGSRAMGKAIADHHLRGCEEEESGLRYLRAESHAGREYLNDLSWARLYAQLNRFEMVDSVAALLGQLLRIEMDEDSMISCDHNHVQQEQQLGSACWVHRKGALSAREDEPGLIPGSMGTESYHTEGRGCAEALLSSSHGAGRTMSRTEARQRISTKELNRQMRGVWFDRKAAARLRDEAPGAYKDVGAVMRAQRELTRIVRRVRPLLVFKG